MHASGAMRSMARDDDDAMQRAMEHIAMRAGDDWQCARVCAEKKFWIERDTTLEKFFTFR